MAKRLNLSTAIPRLIAAARTNRHADMQRCAEVIAVSLERDGDVAAAAAVREAILPTGTTMRVWSPVPRNECATWHEPVDLDGELVLEGELREDLDRLLVELEAVPAFVEAGIDAPARVLFSGPSGTGKTLVARWLAGKLGLPLAVVRIDQVVKSLMGETAATLAKVFESMAGSPAVLFLDEIDGLCESRTGRGEDVHREMARTTTSILQRLDGLPPQQIVIAATNLPERLDAALLRRLAVQVVFPLPSVQARTRMIEQWLARAPVTPEQIKFLAAETQGLAGAEVRARAMAFGRERVLAERARKDSAA